MYFLETIEGTNGEKFTSAILKYLFINSDGFRRLFLDHIQQHFAASKTLSFRNGVICRTEVATEEGDGFVDLVVIGDNAVLGIENKIWAEIQDDQPKKYLPTLKTLAEERCGDRDAFKVVMLAPTQRKEEIDRTLNAQGVSPDESIFIDWQSVMVDLETLTQEESGEVASVARAFHEYLAQRINDVRINAKPEKIVGDVQLGNRFQEDFLYKVWQVFENGGRIVSGGKTSKVKWYGFSFDFKGKRIESWKRPWFGFCTVGTGVFLLVQTHQANFPPPSDSFVESQFSTDGDVRLEVRLDEGDDSVPKWSQKLQPLFDELRSRLEDSPPEEHID